MASLRIASLNTGLADWAIDLSTWEVRAQKVANLVVDLRIDLLLLQEVWRINWAEADDPLRKYLTSLGITGDHNKDDILSAALGASFSMNSSLIPSSDQGRKQSGLYWGLGLASRYPIKHIEHQALSYTKFDRWPRIVQHAQIELPGGKNAATINVHLPAESQEARLRTGLETLAYSRSRNMPITCLGGDMNAFPQSGTPQIFLSEYSDCWSSANNRAVRYEADDAHAGSSLFRTVDEGRIDYIFAQRTAKVANSTYLYGDYGSAPLSDHPFVVVDIDIGP